MRDGALVRNYSQCKYTLGTHTQRERERERVREKLAIIKSAFIHIMDSTMRVQALEALKSGHTA